ncbi:hypothetical protein CDA09_07660 [Azoarcus sp. DN11]|nr:hypothetical protein CDA09_07660 [Azoarcus sp. DN11]
MLSLINDLLDLAKIESGKVELHPTPVVCQEVVNEVAAALAPLAESRGIRFAVKQPRRRVVVHTDRRAFSQILINFANNAVKFTERGSVRIEVAECEENGQAMAKVDVVDTGVGIRPEDQAKLFQAFQQVGTVHREEGTGLGLHLCQRLAGLIGAHIEFASEYGRGSRFTLYLPLQQAAGGAEPARVRGGRRVRHPVAIAASPAHE